MQQPAALERGQAQGKLGCAFKGCIADALEDSFWCEAHRPELQIDQTRGRMPLRWQMALAGGCTALFLWVLPWLASAIKASQSAAEVVQTFGIHIACRRPELGEQLVIVVGPGGVAPHDCVYVRTRPTDGVTK
jgi:hypothetical protein